MIIKECDGNWCLVKYGYFWSSMGILKNMEFGEYLNVGESKLNTKRLKTMYKTSECSSWNARKINNAVRAGTVIKKRSKNKGVGFCRIILKFLYLF